MIRIIRKVDWLILAYSIQATTGLRFIRSLYKLNMKSGCIPLSKFYPWLCKKKKIFCSPFWSQMTPSGTETRPATSADLHWPSHWALSAPLTWRTTRHLCFPPCCVLYEETKGQTVAKCAARVANSGLYFLMTRPGDIYHEVSTSACCEDIRMCRRVVFIGATMSVSGLYLSSASPLLTSSRSWL